MTERPELHLKYRPKKLSDVIGQEEAVTSLKQMLKEGKLPHSILFIGGPGIGKTSIARILAKELDCHPMELHEINAADDRGIEMARDIIQHARLAPMMGTVRVFLIDEIHQASKKLNGDAQTTLLKVIEEPPPHSYFFACTTHPGELLPTLRQRFCEVKLQPIAHRLLSDLTHDTAQMEGNPITDAVADAIAEAAGGSARVALKLLHQVIDLDEDTQLSLCQQATEGEETTVKELLAAAFWEKGVDYPKVQKLLGAMPKETEWEQVRRAILTCAHKIMITEKSPARLNRAYQIIQAFRDSSIYIGPAAISAGFYEVLIRSKEK